MSKKCHKGVVQGVVSPRGRAVHIEFNKTVNPKILYDHSNKFRNTSWIRLIDLKVGLTWILPETYRNQNRNRGKATRQEL